MPGTTIWTYWFIFSPLLGLLVGSFLNVCIYRLPKKETIVKGHSYCPACKHELNALDLVPVLSYLFLRGKCRYCHKKISARYALIEIVSGLYVLLAMWRFRPSVFSASGTLFSDFLTFFSDPVYSSLLLSLSASFCFFLLLIWAMILKDGQAVPAKLYFWFIIPVFLRLILQPDVMITNMIVLLIYLAGLVFLFLVMGILFRQKLSFQHSLPYLTGFGLMVLYGGPHALAAVLIIYTAGYSLIALIESNVLFNRHPADTKSAARAHSNKAAAIRSILPVFSLLSASVWWLY